MVAVVRLSKFFIVRKIAHSAMPTCKKDGFVFRWLDFFKRQSVFHFGHNFGIIDKLFIERIVKFVAIWIYRGCFSCGTSKLYLKSRLSEYCMGMSSFIKIKACFLTCIPQWRMQDFVQSLSDRSQLRNKSNCSYKIFHRASSITPVSGSLTFANQL